MAGRNGEKPSRDLVCQLCSVLPCGFGNWGIVGGGNQSSTPKSLRMIQIRSHSEDCQDAACQGQETRNKKQHILFFFGFYLIPSFSFLISPFISHLLFLLFFFLYLMEFSLFGLDCTNVEGLGGHSGIGKFWNKLGNNIHIHRTSY